MNSTVVVPAASPVLHGQTVSGLLDSLGTAEFGHSFFGLVRRQFNVADCTAFFFFPGDHAPAVVVAEGRGQRAIAARQVAEDYAHEFFARDQNLSSLRAELSGRSTACSPVACRHVHRDAIADTAYRSRFYDSVDIEGKFSFLARASLGTIYVNLYRAPRQGAFRPDEVETLRQASTLFASALRKHLAMMPPYLDGRCRNSARLQRVHQLLAMGRGSRLTAREAEVCAHVILGYSSIAIASILGITVGTVATLRKRAYARIGIASQNELFALCLDNVGH